MKIYLTGAENIGWALDTDIKFAEQALKTFASINKRVAFSDYIHSVSPNTTFNRFAHYGDRFISVFQGEPKRFFEKDENGFLDFCIDKTCVAQSRQAVSELKKYNIEQVKYIPYIADLHNFHPIKDKNLLRQKYGIDKKKFVIGNFMRDSLGADLSSPKLEKGPDVFIKIVKQVCEKIGYDQLLVLLGGPRRHWIRNELKKEGIYYIFIGNLTLDDDMKINILPPHIVNELINISDLVIISSRSEGGPRGILETSAAGVPIISTDVGLARDVLSNDVIYNNISDAVEMVIKQFCVGAYNDLCKENYEKIKKNHSLEYISPLWKKFYEEQERKHMGKKRYAVSINDFNLLYAIKHRNKNRDSI